MNPIQCPACLGRGSHPGSAPRKRVRCKGCDGKGLLWQLAPYVAPTPIVPWLPYVAPIPLGPWSPATGEIIVTCGVS